MAKNNRLIILFLCALAFSISIFCFNSYSSYLVNDSSDLVFLSSLDLNLDDYKKIESDIKAIEKALEFMVWPQERRKLLERAILLTQQLINKDPVNSTNWKRLLAFQYEYFPDQEKISWMLNNIHTLDGWNNKVLINIFRYCVPFIFDGTVSEPEICSEVVQHLSKRNEKARLANIIGVSQADLDFILKFYNGEE